MYLYQIKDMAAVFWFLILIIFAKYTFNIKVILFVLSFACIIDVIFSITNIGRYYIDIDWRNIQSSIS